MISIRRWVTAGIPLFYVFYLPVPSIFTSNIFTRALELLALLIYFGLSAITLLRYKGLLIPIWLAIVNALAAVVLPTLVIMQRHASQQENIGGWLVMGVGVLLTATAVRQHSWLAVIGLTALVAQIVIIYGPAAIASQGLVGAIVFVLAGLGVSRGLRRANREAEAYFEQQAKAQANIAAIEAAQIARQERLQEVLSVAIPMLERISQATESLSSEEKLKTKKLELALRDEIRGRGLLTPDIRLEVDRLRNLGVEVALLDEGGLEELPETERHQILKSAIEALAVVTEGRVTIRSPKNETFRLTVVATLPGQAAPVLNIKL